MKANINKLYATAAFHGLILFYSFDKVFLQLNGLSITQVVLIEVIYIATILLIEVPSGALSDRWSRKYVLSLSGVFFALYIVMFAAGSSFLAFSVGAIFAGVGSAFLSGTDTSILFDSLKELKLDDAYERYLGRTRAISALSYIFAAAAGGFIGQRYGLEAAFWLSLPSMILAAIIALTIREPHFHRSTDEVNYWQHAKQTFSFLTQQPRFLHFAALITAVTVPMFVFDEYAQVYYAFIGIGAIGLGLLGSVGSAFDAVFNVIVFWFKRFRHDVLFGVMLLIFCSGFISVWLFQNWLGIVLLISSTVAFYVIEIIAMADINRQLPSKIRATSESFFSLATQTARIPIALGFGVISQKYSVAAGFGSIGIALLAYTTYYWLGTVRRIDPKGRI